MIVPLYSIAKVFTAAAVLRSFTADTTIGHVLPTLPAPLTGLDLRSLLNHRSGLNDYGARPDYAAAVRQRGEPWPVDAVLARATVGPPGIFAYSNIGYTLLRLALERAHGGSFFSILDALVLAPLHIVAYEFATRDDWAVCDQDLLTDDLRDYHPGWVHTGTIAGDPDEAARGLALIMRGELTHELAAQMRDALPVDAPADHPLQPGAGYGLGLMTRGTPPTVVGHGGGGPGFSLFAAATADGSRWKGLAQKDLAQKDLAQAGENDGNDLIRQCLNYIGQ